MKIEIDTKHDTKEELSHLAKMLSALSGNSSSQVFEKPQTNNNNIFNDEPQQSGGLFNLFNNSSEPSSPAQEVTPTTTQQASVDMPTTNVLSMLDTPTTENTNSEEKKDLVDGLRIIPY